MQNKSQVTASEQGVVPPPTRKHQCLFTVNRSFVGASGPTEAAGKQTSNSSSQVWWFHSFELRVLRHVINLSISPMCSSIKIISAWKPDASFFTNISGCVFTECGHKGPMLSTFLQLLIQIEKQCQHWEGRSTQS